VFVKKAGEWGSHRANLDVLGERKSVFFATVWIGTEAVQPAAYPGRTLNHGLLYVPGLCMHRPMGVTEISIRPVFEPSFEPWTSEIRFMTLLV
jgi:hypothetical protein